MNQELSVAALTRYAELRRLQASGLDYPDGSVEFVTADVLIEGDVIRSWKDTRPQWVQITGGTYSRSGVVWDVRLLRTDDNAESGATGETDVVRTTHTTKVERLAVDY